jgi:hypothetical protein
MAELGCHCLYQVALRSRAISRPAAAWERHPRRGRKHRQRHRLRPPLQPCTHSGALPQLGERIQFHLSGRCLCRCGIQTPIPGSICEPHVQNSFHCRILISNRDRHCRRCIRPRSMPRGPFWAPPLRTGASTLTSGRHCCAPCRAPNCIRRRHIPNRTCSSCPRSVLQTCTAQRRNPFCALPPQVRRIWHPLDPSVRGRSPYSAPSTYILAAGTPIGAYNSAHKEDRTDQAIAISNKLQDLPPPLIARVWFLLCSALSNVT